MNKMIPIGLFSTLLLTACGGDSGGGGGSPAPIKYTWQFVQMKELTKTGMTQFCGNSAATVFSADETDAESANWLYTFAVKAPGFSNTGGIFVYKSDGTLYTEGRLTKQDVHQTEGTLEFTENDIPEGGYITVVDNANGIDNVLVVQKKALVDGMIKVNYNQGKQQCYTGNALKADPNKKKINIGISSGGATTTNVETYFDGKLPKDNLTLKENLTVLSTTESVLLSGYDADGDINAFAYVDKNQLSNMAMVGNPKTIYIDPIFDKTYIDLIDSVASDFGDLSINSIYKGNTFEWFTWSQYSSSFDAWAPLDPAYHYSAFYQGKFNGWDVAVNRTISEGYTSINLSTLDMSTTAPAFDCSGLTCLLTMSEVTNQSISVSEVNFSQDNARYTIFASGSDITIPKISGVDYPTQSTPLKTSFLLASKNNAELTQAFYVLGNTKNYQPSAEYIEMILPPALDIKHREVLTTNQYTYISR
ncbi:hypothetical protein ERW49_18670 [Aliivibrio finisterrensis]|uniref:Lipoprotein n=1 Tax=Aliivibrio finisterrensis TaxID=511998 RepID=A0A4Q5K6V8_9GAMM|nr:hypothetical protein [Aliivibrio finisterrensis]RYU41524.1 hypothetical protein ERW49_18670 [Aliivibrio finisterrensis]